MLEILDLKDRKILYQLDLNCRQSNNQIGKAVKLGKEVVAYRIVRMQERGVIKRFSTVINTYKLGYQKYKLYLKLQASKEQAQEIVEFLKNHNKTEWVALCSGTFDLIIGYLVEDYYEFNVALKEFLTRYKENIVSKDITLTLGVPHFNKDYLVGKRSEYSFIDQSGTSEFEIDETDDEILKILANNARLGTTQIASRLNTTARIVDYKIRTMKQNNILLMHRPFISLPKLNMKFCKSFLYLNHSEQESKKFMTYLQTKPNLTYVINCIGPWDMELEFEIESFEKFIEEMNDLKSRFPEFLKSYNYVIVLDDIKLDYYPNCYPQF